MLALLASALEGAVWSLQPAKSKALDDGCFYWGGDDIYENEVSGHLLQEILRLYFYRGRLICINL